MAAAALSRCSLIFSCRPLSRFSLFRCQFCSSARSNFRPSHLLLSPVANSFSSAAAATGRGNTGFSLDCSRTFTARSHTDHPKPKNRNTKVNFSLSDSESDTEDDGVKKAEETGRAAELRPPYDPFNKKPAVEEPEDPKNLQEIFHRMRSEGLTNHAVKMFDALSKDGRTHEALELFAQIKDRGHIPDVVAHTAVIEAYANAGGQSKAATKVFMRMLASGVEPNAYTYAVLIKGLAGDGNLGEVRKYVTEMMGKEMTPNAGTCVAVFEAYVREGKEEEGRELLNDTRKRGFVPDERRIREALGNKRGPAARSVMNILFDK